MQEEEDRSFPVHMVYLGWLWKCNPITPELCAVSQTWHFSSESHPGTS